MIIGIDGNEANQKIRVGSGQYAFNLLTSLVKISSNHTYHIYLKDQPLDDLPPATSNWHYHVFGPKKLWTKLALSLRLLINPDKLELFYTPTHYGPLFSSIPFVPTIHDIGYLQTPNQFTKKDYYQLAHWTKQSLDLSRHIIAVSQFTKNELIKTYHIPQEKIFVVENGVGEPPIIDSVTQEAIINKFHIKKPYFLSLGTLKPNKNYPLIIESFAKFHQTNPEYLLVIAGKKGWLFEDIYATAQKHNIENSVIFTDYINETEKWSLLSNAYATVTPSLYEGFGIPTIESQKVNTPVIASKIPSYQEVLGNSAILINPKSVTGLVDALNKIKDKKCRQKYIQIGKLQANQYTWDKSAQKLTRIFSGLKAI